MPLLSLSIDHLRQLDGGKAALAIDRAIRRAVDDIMDRPADKTARKVTVTLSLAPELDKDTGALDNVQVGISARTKVPDLQTISYPMLPAPKGSKLLFQTMSPHDPRQGDLGFPEREDAPGGQAVTKDGEAFDPETGEVLS